MRKHLLRVVLFYCLIPTVCSAQEQPDPSVADKTLNLPAGLFRKLQGQSDRLNQQLTHQTEKYLQRMSAQEARIRKRMYRMDSAAARKLYAGDSGQRYSALAARIHSDTTTNFRPMNGQYLPYADSLQGSLAFLNRNPALLASGKLAPGEVQHCLDQVRQLQSRMLDAGEVQQYLQQRRAILQQYISHYTQVPSGIRDAFQDYNKQLACYTQQVNAYKEMLNDPDKLLKTALQLLNKLPAFTSFMRSNSFLPAIFGMPANTAPGQAVQGMATRDQLQSVLRGLPGAGGPNTGGMVQQNLGAAQNQVDQLRNKLNAGGGDMTMPDYHLNDQRTKSFLQRLEYGINLQSQHSNYYFPTTTDIGLSLGYRLGHENVAGIGASYKVGWGEDFNHIHVSSQGVGLRSFLDIHIKKTWFASGGLEYNYQQVFYSTAVFQNLSDWQQSGLVGISKIISMRTKLLKKAKMQVLWDFLSYQQVPRTAAFKFRIGYTF